MRTDSTDFVKKSEVPPLIESAHQRHEAGLKSCVAARIQERKFIGGMCSLLFSFSLIDRLTSFRDSRSYRIE